MDIIRLNNISLFARHGVAPQERELGQRFLVDIELATDLTAAAQQDDLTRSIDYQAVYHAAAGAFTASPCQLLEHAAWQVMKALFQRFPAEEITVRIRKPSIPIDGVMDAAEVELSRHREEVLDG
ncbi:MAG: dihydroneopterin aldolase [Fidelibacterota bacterium]|nr:MAG: dihydroneopterin aldolase [Candidatus Neomarinimicrobiota bacterium]